MASRKIDPGLFTIIMGTYDSIAKEMSIALERSSWSTILTLARDFSVCIIDDEFNLVAVPEEILPGQALSLQRMVEKMAAFYEGDIDDGDVILCNMAYYGCLHGPEIAVAVPVFYEGEILFWTADRGHQIDMGLPAPTTMYPPAKDIYGEGLKIPPVKIYEKGKPKKDIINLYLENLRYRTLVHGDLMAHVGAALLGKQRLIEFVDKYGVETIKTYTQELLDYTDRIVAGEIRQMKEGTYYGEDWIDTNCHGIENVSGKVKLTVTDDMWIVDLSETGPQLPGGINGTFHGVTEAVIASTLAFSIDPRIPKNEGICRHYKIICPEGNLFNAQYPSATILSTGGAMNLLYHALFRAVAQVRYETGVAGSTYGSAGVHAGVDYREGRNTPFSLYHFNQSGGSGAGYGADGYPCFIDFEVAAGMRFMSIELMEWIYPLLVQKCEVAMDTAGAGKWRGSPGVDWILTTYDCSPLENGNCALGIMNCPYGAYGGKPGTGRVTYDYNPQNPEKRRFHAPGTFVIVPSGNVFREVSSGGGGYGDPLERDPDLVRMDAKDEFISVAAAKEDYGVVLDPKTFEIDRKATKALRNQIKRERGPLPVVSPTEPGSATLLKRMMTEKDEYVDTPGV